MQRLGALFARLAARWLPDPLVLALSLTLLVAALAAAFPHDPAVAAQPLGERLATIAALWFDALWNPSFLAFALQMCLILLGGYALAATPLAERVLGALAGHVCTNRSAVALVAFVSCAGCWLNWGFGLITAGVLAQRVRRELADRGVGCQHALIVAAAYSGMMIWHAGLSGSAPLRVAQTGVEAVVSAGVEAVGSAGAPPADSRGTGVSPVAIPPLPITRTTLSAVNLTGSAFFILAIPLLLTSMAAQSVTTGETPMLPAAVTTGETPMLPAAGGTPALSTHGPEAHATRSTHGPEAHVPPPNPQSEIRNPKSPAQLLDRLRAIPLLVGLGLVAALVLRLRATGAAAVDLNFVIGLFFAAALLLHRDAMSFMSAVSGGGRALTAIVVQFPLYSGIQGLMAGAGLAAALSYAAADAAQSLDAALGLPPRVAYPVATMLAAGLVNLVVPSGGGQWIVQGPIACAAAQRLGLPVEQTIMAVAYGDQWTNMIQPFWALPLMGLTQVNPREFMGYCALLLLAAGPCFALVLILMG